MLRAEFTSWIFQIRLSWMKDSGQHCLLERTVRQNLLPRHMNAIHSIKAVWTLIFKHTFKLSHLIATVSQVTFYVTRSIHRGLKICQPKSIRLVDLTVTYYLAQNLNWKTGSLTSCLYFNKKQSSARFIPTCDEVKKPTPNPESRFCYISKSVPIKAPLFAHLSLDSLACWKQYYSEQELIFI